MRTMVFSERGQCSGGPSAVLDQSTARMRAPLSPPPARKANSEWVGSAGARGVAKWAFMVRRPTDSLARRLRALFASRRGRWPTNPLPYEDVARDLGHVVGAGERETDGQF